jgi:signal transduction histidine kinase
MELNLEPVVCGPIIEEVAGTLRPLAEKKGLALTLALPESDVPILTDRRAFNQIAINLASNAIKFTEHGRVSLSLEHRSDPGSRVTHVLEVEDTGCGISAEDQPRLFEAFAQLDPSSTRRHEGSGLGLHLSQKLAELIGGEISCKSEVGKGSRFTLVIPER